MTPIRFIALRLTPYSDTRSILTAYSREHGRVALSVAAGGGRRSGRVKALTLPLSLVEGVITPRAGREIWNVSQLAPAGVYPSLHTDPVKQMMAMFLAEMLSVTLGSSGPDAAVFDFIEMSIDVLDKADATSTANFHICFLYQLAALLGIEPDMETYREGAVLDLREGIFRRLPPVVHSDWLPAEASKVAHSLARMRYGNMHCWRLNRTERGEIVDTILKYYSIHFAPLRSLRTLGVLRSLM